ncbi:glutamate receptor-like [Penaeus japonicus]|uniref:glutamate receptor-like n=1 Tax=Penaeus japonicus TaxID=27405 RepID=UPI001C7142F6|nr:glutamate receptor-like [Penaeus japonicus]
MAAPLEDVLNDFQVLADLQNHPDTFRFKGGVSLVVTTEHEHPYVVIHEDGDGVRRVEGTNLTVSGLMIRVLDSLADSINFTYILVRPPAGELSEVSANGTATGMLGQLCRHEADLALWPFWITEDRHRAIDFTISISQIRNAIVSANDRGVVSPWSFVTLLTPGVWMWLAGVMALTWFVITLVRKDDEKRSCLSQAGDTLLQVVGVLLQQGLTMRLRNAHEKLIMGAWLMTTSILAWSFAENILSIFLVRIVQRPFLNLQDLGVHSSVGVILPPDPALVSFLEDRLGKSFLARTEQHEFSEYHQLLDTVVRDREHVMIMSLDLADQLMADMFTRTGNCDFYKSKEDFFVRNTAMAVPKGSPLLPAINARHLDLIEVWKTTLSRHTVSSENQQPHYEFLIWCYQKPAVWILSSKL